MYPTPFGTATNPMLQPTSSFMFAPGIFFSNNEAENYLSSLDSDTREYVLRHTDDFRSRQDIEDCIYQLHHGAKMK